MKTFEVKLYSFNELPEFFREKIIEKKKEQIYNDPFFPSLEEGMDSLHAIAKELGFKLRDWQVGPYTQCRASVGSYESGNKEIARFLNCLIKKGYSRPKKFSEMEFPGICGFTGVCYDDDLCEVIWKELIDGENWNCAFYAAAVKLGKIIEDEINYQMTTEAIMENMDLEEEIYTIDGEVFSIPA